MSLCSEFDYKDCYNATVCQVEPNGEYVHTCARLPSASFARRQPGDHLSYRMQGGSADRVTWIELNCNVSEKGSMDYIGEITSLEYEFVLNSYYACPVPPPNSQQEENHNI
eukprot:m.312380 g.312380  ORF g.312380 m.312380 type:complete len:111 (+) comp255936_c0_seq1:216-548(+)